MKFETLINLAGSVIFGLLGITALIGAIFFGAWWLEKPLNFAPFGHAELSLLAKI